MKAALLALARLFFAATLLVPSEAQATSCAPPELEPSLERATLVFTGRASVQSETGHQTLVTMTLDRVFKGSAPRKLEVSGGGLKGATFETGKGYLVFARIDPDGQVFAHLCGGTQALPSDWVKRLGSGSAPTTGGKAVAAVPEAGATPNAASDPSSPELAGPEPSAPEAPLGDPVKGPSGADAPPAAPAPNPNATPPPSGGCGSCGVPAQTRAPGALPWLLLVAAVASRRWRARVTPRSGQRAATFTTTASRRIDDGARFPKADSKWSRNARTLGAKNRAAGYTR